MEEEFESEEGDFLSKADYDAVVQKVCQNIDPSNGIIKELKDGTSKCFARDNKQNDFGQNRFGAFRNLYSSAAYSALLAVNNPNAIIIGVEMKFLAPIELGNEVLFKAQSLQEDTKKREVKVEGFVLDIKIFDAMFLCGCV